MVYTFSAFFDPANRDAVCKFLKNWFPDEYEQVTGKKIGPGESLMRDARMFKAQHEKDWVVDSAVISSTQPTMVECTATRGGARSTCGAKQEEKSFLVPKSEYDQRARFGFIIDTERHREFTKG